MSRTFEVLLRLDNEPYRLIPALREAQAELGRLCDLITTNGPDIIPELTGEKESMQGSYGGRIFARGFTAFGVEENDSVGTLSVRKSARRGETHHCREADCHAPVSDPNDYCRMCMDDMADWERELLGLPTRAEESKETLALLRVKLGAVPVQESSPYECGYCEEPANPTGICSTCEEAIGYEG